MTAAQHGINWVLLGEDGGSAPPRQRQICLRSYLVLGSKLRGGHLNELNHDININR